MPKLILFIAYEIIPVEIINNLLVDQKPKVDRSTTLFKTMHIADIFLNLESIFLQVAVKQF